MKIYRRAAFLELPAGVIYAKGKPWHFNDLAQKHETILDDNGTAMDFTYVDLVAIKMGHDSGEYFARLDRMLEAGESYPMEDDLSRDGCFDDEDLFLVYEAADLQRLTAIVGSARSVS